MNNSTLYYTNPFSNLVETSFAKLIHHSFPSSPFFYSSILLHPRDYNHFEASATTAAAASDSTTNQQPVARGGGTRWKGILSQRRNLTRGHANMKTGTYTKDRNEIVSTLDKLNLTKVKPISK